jgi:hypothetical protein
MEKMVRKRVKIKRNERRKIQISWLDEGGVS